MKKIISIVLILATVFSLMAGMSFSSSAITDVWESEPNENPNQTNSLKFGEIMHGYTMGYQYGSEEDYFKIKINETTNFKIKFDHVVNYTYGSGWDLILYKLNSYDNGYYDYFDGKKYSSYQYNYYAKVKSDEGINYSPLIYAQAGDIFVLRIKSEYGGKQQGNVNYMISLNPIISTPSALTPIARKTNSQTVSWNKVSGVDGYQVQCSDGGSKWAQTKNVTANSASFSGLTAGGKYKFRVRAYKVIDGTKYYSAWSSTLCSCAKPATVTIKGVSSPKHTQIKTTWAKAGGVVSGYQILYGKNASFSSIAARKNVSGKSTVSYTGKNFTKGRTYYVKVRTYTVFNGVTYYGAWSAAKKVKCK